MTADREQTRRDAHRSSIQAGRWFFGFTLRRFSVFVAWKCKTTWENYGRKAGLEARLASVPALVEALREASTALSDASVMVETENDGWQVRVYQRLCDEWERADAALTVYEQSQGKP